MSIRPEQQDVALRLLATVRADMLPPKQGTAMVSGKVRYEPSTTAFYLQDARIEELALDGVPASVHSVVQATASKALDRLLSSMPTGTRWRRLCRKLCCRIATDWSFRAAVRHC